MRKPGSNAVPRMPVLPLGVLFTPQSGMPVQGGVGHSFNIR
jgi:hypothetical protein